MHSKQERFKKEVFIRVGIEGPNLGCLRVIHP